MAEVTAASGLPIGTAAQHQVKSLLIATIVETWAPFQAVDIGARRIAEREHRFSYGPDSPIQVSHPSHASWLTAHAHARLVSRATNLARAIRRTTRHIHELPVPRPRDIRAITDLALLGSETHNGGQQPVLIRFSRNQAVVYKPVNLQIDRRVATALAGLCARSGLSDLFMTLRYATPGRDYGFVEYVQPDGRVSNDAAAQRFFFRFGALIAIAYALNVTDMHMENVFAVGEHPLLIDLETALYRFPDGIRPTDITLTGLIEARSETTSRSSGLQGGGSCRVWGVDCRFENSRLTVGYRRDHYHTANRLQGPHGGLLDLRQFQSQLIAGFDLGYRLAQSSRSWLLKHIEADHDEMKTRYILRFTAYYLLHLYRLLQPSASTMTVREGKLLKQLRNDESSAGGVDRGLARREAMALLRGDVPYFWATVDSCDLKDDRGMVAKGFFASTPLCVLREQLERLSEHDRKVQREFLAAAIR